MKRTVYYRKPLRQLRQNGYVQYKTHNGARYILRPMASLKKKRCRPFPPGPTSPYPPKPNNIKQSFTATTKQLLYSTSLANDGKGHPRSVHECPEGEQRYRSTLSSTSALYGVGSHRHPRPLFHRERTGTHCIRNWVGPRAGLDRCGKSRRHRDSIPGP